MQHEKPLSYRKLKKKKKKSQCPGHKVKDLLDVNLKSKTKLRFP